MTKKQIESIDRYTAVFTTNMDLHHSLISRRATLPKSYHSVLDLIPNHLQNLNIKNPLVLDLAMGSGGSSKYLEKNKLNVVKSDLNLSTLKINKGIRARCYADKLPFKPESFDAIHFKDALIHIEDKQKLFAELYRVLKSQGILLLTSAQHSDDPYFHYLYRENDKMVIKETSFNTLKDYRRTVSRINRSGRVIFITPPYFRTEKEEIEHGLDNAKLKVIKSSTWKKKFHEPDWYDGVEPRLVYIAEKES